MNINEYYSSHSGPHRSPHFTKDFCSTSDRQRRGLGDSLPAGINVIKNQIYNIPQSKSQLSERQIKTLLKSKSITDYNIYVKYLNHMWSSIASEIPGKNTQQGDQLNAMIQYNVMNQSFQLSPDCAHLSQAEVTIHGPQKIKYCGP